MNREKYFIDLSDCSQEQQKHIFSLLQTDKITAQIYYMIRKSDWGVLKAFSHLFFNEYSVWQLCSNRSTETYGKTELLYPEFIKLFEGGEEETSLQIALKALENIINPIGYMKSQLKDGESFDGHYAIMISDKPKFYQDIAKEALEKINSK